MAPAAFPALGAATAVTPRCLAIETAADMPRALKLAVGLTPSSLMYHRSPSRGAWWSGVKPSPNEIGSHGGNTSRYRHIVGSRSFNASFKSVEGRISYCASNGLPQVQVLISWFQS